MSKDSVIFAYASTSYRECVCCLLLTLRISPSIHAEIASAAEASGKSLNKWIADTLDQVVHAH